MQNFVLNNYIDNKELFSGVYNSFLECIEDAVERNIDLSYINLKNENLSNANLDGANMPRALLSGANLTGANLSEANLMGSMFHNCSLYNTCLSYSNLYGCDFRGANFGATLIEGVNIQKCIFSTLSCFELEFYFVDNMSGCIFTTTDGFQHNMSRPPIILKGLMNTPVIILDDTIKIGAKILPRKILPKLISLLSSHILPRQINRNRLNVV